MPRRGMWNFFIRFHAPEGYLWFKASNNESRVQLETIENYLRAWLPEWCKQENMSITQTREMTEAMRQALKEGGYLREWMIWKRIHLPEGFCSFCSWWTAGMGVLHLLFSTDPEWRSFFNLAYEENLPTWYSSFQFLLVAGEGMFCYAVKKTSNKPAGCGWLVVALCMRGLAIDETFQIHEGNSFSFNYRHL